MLWDLWGTSEGPLRDLSQVLKLTFYDDVLSKQRARLPHIQMYRNRLKMKSFNVTDV